MADKEDVNRQNQVEKAVYLADAMESTRRDTLRRLANRWNKNRKSRRGGR